jgi:SagB-type dehydrogenase family enzyme
VVTARPRAGSGEQGPEPWYVLEGKRGQQLLDQGQLAEATQVFEAILGGLGDAPSYGKALILERLGRCLQLGGQPDLAVEHLRDAIGVAGRLAPSKGVKTLRCTLRSELGDALRAKGQYGDARRAYQAALTIAEELHDLRGQGIDLGRLGGLALASGDLEEALTRSQAALALFRRLREPAAEAVVWHQLGRIFQERRQWDEADRHYREAVRINEERGDMAGARQSWSQLVVLNQEAGRPDAAEEWCRKAIAAHRRVGISMHLVRRLSELAALLGNLPGRLGEARHLAEEALGIAHSLDPGAAEAWRVYGILADVSDKEAAVTADSRRRAGLQAQARDYHELERRAPLIAAIADRIGEAPSYGRAVILGRLGRCFHAGGRPDLGVTHLRQALGVAGELAPSDARRALQSSLQAELGQGLRAMGRDREAQEAYEESRRLAEAVGDRHGQPGLPAAGEAPEFEITVHEDVITECVFDLDLLVDGPRERRIIRWSGEPDPLPDHLRPLLVPCARTWMDEQGAVRFRLPMGEPAVERDPGCTVMRRIGREVAVSGSSDVLWQLIRGMDGNSAVAEMLSGIAPGERETAVRLLATLAATGVIDVSGRPLGRFLHEATKKGVLPAGGLHGDEVLLLATDGNYRTYPEVPRVIVGQAIPPRLRTFHALTRSRRSCRDYGGHPLSREEFDGLLSTACGVTGAMPWAGREVKLRAYPSSGALYAVEIYPVVFRVEGLEPGVYHYGAVENVLEAVKPGMDPARFVGAALPVEREMVAGAAAMFCLAGYFPRHERKYGEGGYRMMVAEAGHISQNLILAATALGLSARPFGGVFDDLLNHDLGLDGAQEQFLLAVVVGRAGGTS